MVVHIGCTLWELVGYDTRWSPKGHPQHATDNSDHLTIIKRYIILYCAIATVGVQWLLVDRAITKHSYIPASL
jgi:hypothetical protein